ncbi:flagellar assembly protein FliH [Sporosarcina sp. E16_8]|uniref:flagellar assembly protein FliH n=1 Tax=Sporosarcina sp. E16_8 TaxID=2789295 RepID=UPI001A932A89|nr:flagellar assembly protein FliH [Sporosarcina sp. E16_8]MBO0585785.1 flagellar assembly protein FliH [Sporosarcina sp. E16_8]
MSNVFRSFNTILEEGETKEISIRSLSVSQEVDTEVILSLDSILVERDRLLKEANTINEQEKELIERLRQTATEDILSMQAAWQNEKKALQQQAYDEGFQVGYEEGHSKSLSDMAASISTANETTELSYENARQYLVSQERIILDLAMLSTERIIGQTLQDDDEVYLSVVKRALKETREMKEIKLYVSLDYFELVSDNRSELASIFPPNVPFLIFANDDFESTECYIETNHGRIVVSIDEQLNELRDKLIGIMESGD